jgi:hypothetical protein
MKVLFLSFGQPRICFLEVVGFLASEGFGFLCVLEGVGRIRLGRGLEQHPPHPSRTCFWNVLYKYMWCWAICEGRG